ncbi:MAG: glycosyltransferase family 4 protein [Sphaerochaetaceae bacterium]
MYRIGIPSFGTDHGRSGIGSYLRELLIRFDDPDLANEFYFELIGPQEDALVYLQGLARIGWHAVEGADSSPIHNFFWNQLKLPALCRQQGYDLLFFPAANRRLSGRSPCPTVGTVHDMAVLHMPGKYDLIHGIFNRKILPRLITRLDHVLTVSEFSKNDIVWFAKVPAQKITVTLLAADTERFTNPSDRNAVRRGISEKFAFDAPYILYVSRLEHPGKNHVNLIRAFDQVRSSISDRYLLVLSGPDKERAQEIHAEAERSMYAKDIRFTGFVDFADIPKFYQGAALFVLPSRFEGFGLPVLEAMACGTPIITSDAASLPEIGGPQTPRFPVDDVGKMAEQMIRLLTDSSASADLATTNSAWVASFSWEKTVGRTLDIFRAVVDKERGGS